MFDKLDFWATWPKRQKYSLFFLLAVLVVSIFYLFISYYSGGAFVLDWETQTISTPIRILYDRYYSGLFEFPIFADNQVMNKILVPGELSYNTLASYAFLLVFFAAVLFLYALATTLSRFYFIIASVFFALILVSFRFENLLIFGFYGKEAYAGILLLFFGSAYYLHSFREEVGIAHRYITFLCIGFLVALLIVFFSQVESPFLYLITYNIVSPLIFSVIFILMLGFEVVRGFLQIISQTGSGEGKNNLFHFMFISIIYLLVLVFIFLYNQNYISWKLIFVDAVWILLVAAIFGFWGFRNKEEIYSYLFQFRPVGAYVYLTLAIICFSSFAFFFVTANDPYVEILEDVVIMSQLSFGFLFFIYVIANFFPAMMEGHPVHKVIYNPKFMPYFSAKMGAFVGFAALFFVMNMAPYYRAFSGYYISLAQLFKLEGKNLLAEEYFKLSNVYGQQTHMGNYALAEVAENNGDNLERDKYLARAINVHPTEFAYAKFANTYYNKSKYFDEVFTLKNGVNQFPESGPLNNNLGFALSRTSIVDTALFYLDKASMKGISKIPAQTNTLAIYASKRLPVKRDSLVQFINEEADIGILNNLMVISNFNQWKTNIDMDVNFEVGISMDDLIFNYNLLFHDPLKADSTAWKDFRDFYQKAAITSFQTEMDYAFALAYAKSNRSIAALRILKPLSDRDNFGYSKYDILLAQIYMKFGSPKQAVEKFDQTARFYGFEMSIQHALALMEAEKFEEAESVLKGWEESDQEVPDIVHELLALLRIKTIDEILNLNDYSKYNYQRYRGTQLSLNQHEGIIISMEDEGFQYAAYVDLLKRLIKEENYPEARDIIQKINPNSFINPHLRIRYLQLLARYYLYEDHYENMEQFLERYEGDKNELGAVYNLLMAQKLEKDGAYDRAKVVYDELGTYDAFCEECIINSANFFAEMRSDELKGYNILLSAIEINPYSLKLNKAYAQSAIGLGLENYAIDVLAKMSEVLDGDDYQKFEEFVYTTIDKNRSEWE